MVVHLDYKWRGTGFNPHWQHCVVSLSKSTENWLILREWWLCLDMTEKMLTGMLNIKLLGQCTRHIT